MTYGKDSEKHTAKNNAWQRGRKTHGKEKKHDNNPSKRTAKRRSMAKEALRCRGTNFAVRHEGLHGKAPFAVRHATKHGKGAFIVHCLLCRVQISFLSSFLSILFFLILIFFQLVLYFIDYLLVLLKKICIYMLAYNLLYIFIPSHIYQGFGAPAAPARSTPLDFFGRHRVGGLVCSFGFG
jgi:hypothetical protein